MIIDHRYEVIESLGSGIWSNVYKVLDKRSGKLYSLKLFQFLSSAELYEKFSAEDMHHITNIEHPNLAHIVDFGHVGDHIYSVCEYYEGFPLNSFVFKKSQIEFLYDIIIQILYALDALHGQDIIHKDLKPENVLYKIEDNIVQVKVIDYGFAKIDQNKQPQLISGTLPYIAPEIFTSNKTIPASDFYSLGVLLYKITTGNFPFSIEQTNALITGSHNYFIPKFPSELNNDIPHALEKFILRLLERNPDNRFKSAEEIINYINRIQDKQYPYSIEWTLVNKLKFNSYISRTNYCHQILDYIESIENKNGKVVSLVGGDGLGKENTLSLFRYHLLNNRFFLFDYKCSRNDHEPFFALIKEFMQSLTKEELSKYGELINISEKFKLYLFQSINDSKKVAQKQDELKADFESVKNLLLGLSEQKPIIFIVRNAQYVHRYTIEFINYISPFISNHKILILLGFNDYHKANQIDHSILVQLQALSYSETNEYVNKLWHKNKPDGVIKKIWDLSAGNPWFVREILIDWVHKKYIPLNPDVDLCDLLEDYVSPSKVLNSILLRLKRVNAKNYKYLMSLSVLESPINKNVIKYILNIQDKEIYNFIKDAVFSDILFKDKNSYRFVYQEAKQRLKSETDTKFQKSISQAIIKYYNGIPIYDVESCQGMIKNAVIAGNVAAKREYTFRLYQIYDEQHQQDNAYDAILKVVSIDFTPKFDIPMETLISDLLILQEKTELTGLCNCSVSLMDQIKSLPEFFEKHYLLGTIYFIKEELDTAKFEFDQAYKLIVTGKQRILIWLYYCYYYAQKDLDQMHKYIDLISNNSLPLDLNIACIDRLIVYYKLKNELFIAIKTAEDFLSDLSSVQDTRVLIKLASLHNNLGICYSLHKNIDEANVHFNIALSIWKRFDVKRYLGLIYNNIADLYLKQGMTPQASLYSRKGYEIAENQGLQLTIALAMLNLGEAEIKMGNFKEAESYLNKSKKIVLELKSNKFMDSIQMNLALAKSKIISFNYYFKFIKETETNILGGSITEINPLVKTYYYYMFELGLAKKLNKYVRKNAHINFHAIHEDEFYYNILSLIAILNNEYHEALEHLQNATKYASEVKNHYALTVFYLSQIECFIGLGDYSGASDIINKARDLCVEYKYEYWHLKLKYYQVLIELADASTPLRSLLRTLIDICKEADDKSYYLIKFKVKLLIIQILAELKAESEAIKWFEKYKVYIKEITQGIDEEDRQQFLKSNFYYSKNYSDIKTIKISSRYKSTKSNWNELQYSLLNVRNVDRVKYLIEKGIKDIIAPWHFQITTYSEKQNAYSIFLSDTSNEVFTLSPEIFQAIEKSFKSDSIIVESWNDSHNMIVPLQIKYHKIGFMIISDRNELDFTNYETSLIKTIKLHITNLIMRIQDYSEITHKMEMMNKLMSITHSMLKVIDVKSLEQDIVSSIIDFTGSSRGFLIKKDEIGNYLYQVAMDADKSPISNISVVCKTALSECQYTQKPVYTYNALEDTRFKNSISVHDYKLHTIFCAPLLVNDKLFGFIYLDNYLDNSKSMYLNPEVITLLIDQINIALKNALQYKAIVDKSIEMQSLDILKDEFMAIVSHELNTPLTTLQGYITRLKRNIFSDEEEKQDITDKIESNVKKLILTTNDIMTMNSYNLINEIPKVHLNISEILSLIQHETEIISRHRKMIIKLELTKDLPEVFGNWEALHQMLYNVVLNAIRFTNDFGTIIVGARLSAFQQEKINNNESVVIYIQDNGIGIPEYQLNNVFRKFYELNEIYAHKSGTVEYRSSGLGLGLSTAKRIVELHNGKIWIKSKENEGTTVFISLPIN